MATVYIAIGYAQGRTTGGAPIPVRKGPGTRSVKMTSSGTSAKAALVATAAEVNAGALWFGKVIGGTVHVASGTNPTASVSNSHTYGDGDIFEIGINATGEEIAVVDAA